MKEEKGERRRKEKIESNPSSCVSYADITGPGFKLAASSSCLLPFSASMTSSKFNYKTF